MSTKIRPASPRARAARMLRVDLEGAARDADRLEAAAYGLGVQGLEELDASHGLVRGRVGFRFYLPTGKAGAAACERLRGALPGATVTATPHLPPPTRSRAVRLGRGFVVVPETTAPGRSDGRVALVLDPSAAFGDGVHVTTRLVVETLEAIVDRRRHRTALDVGTGTAVLALVAAELGVGAVIAIDVDALARRAARRAVRASRHAGRITVREAMPRATFPLVVANLYRDVLLPIAPRLAARVAEGGTLILSGFGPGSRAAIVARYEARGLSLRSVRTRDGFCVAAFDRDREGPRR